MNNWKLALVFTLVTAVTVAGNVYFWNYYYTNAFRSGYDSGFLDGKDAGYPLGYNEGNETGYEHGHNIGNLSGYQIGYENGYTIGHTDGYMDGNSSGYQLGYGEGSQNGYKQGYNDGNTSGCQMGYDLGYAQGFKEKGFNIRDPTYSETLDFLSSDQTDKKEYNEENYTCLHFTADVKNNAFEIGYRCGFVYIEFPEYSHAIVCFNTTDSGLIFVEPQDDYIVTLTIGEPYWDRTKYEPPGYDDTVVSFTIIW